MACGETTSLPASTPRASAISGVTFSPGRMPPCPGLAPWDSLTSIIFYLVESGIAGEPLFVESAVFVATSEVSGTNLPDQISAWFPVIADMEPFAGIVIEVPHLCASILRLRMALADNEPKLIAEMLKTLALGLHCTSITIRKSASFSAEG